MTAKAQSGVTLLETLIALIILSLAIVAAISMTRGARALNAAAQKRQQNIENAYAESFLGAQFESIAPTVREVVNGVPILDFSGTASEMHFVSASRSDAELPVLQRTAILINGGKLAISRSPLGADSKAATRELMASGGTLKFHYGGKNADRRTVFSDVWEGRDRLPDIILLTEESAGPEQSRLILATIPMLSSSY